MDSNRVIGQTCRSHATAKKRKCSDCKEVCLYTMETLLHQENYLSQHDVIKELMRHGHPSSRQIPTDLGTRMRNTQEASKELAELYYFAHNREIPKFL